MLNRKVTQKWIEALRSGKYTQGKRVLRSNDDNMCCLGVVCDIIDPSKWYQNDHQMSWSYEGSRHSLYTMMRTLIGLSEDQQGKLITMNDHENKTFNEIANQLEAWLAEDEAITNPQS